MGIFADMLLAAGLRRHDQHVNHISNSLFGSLPEKGRCILCGGVDSGEFSNAKQIKLQVQQWMNSLSTRMQRIIRYKFFEEMSWEQVADQMGRKATGESIRKEFNRFLEEK